MRKHLKNYFIPHEHNDFKPHSVRKHALIVIVLFAFVVMLMVFVGSNNVSREALLAEVQEAFLVKLTNENRQENSVSELKYNPILEQAAKLKAKDMIENQYFAHVSPDGKNPWYWLNQVGYKYQFAGENLAIDFYDTKKVAEAWMDSPTHRRNILNSKYTEIGIAVDTGRYKGRKVAFVVQVFASPRVSQSTAINTIKPKIEKTEKILVQSNTKFEDNTKVLGDEIVLELEDPIDDIPTEITAESMVEDNSGAELNQDSFIETDFSHQELDDGIDENVLDDVDLAQEQNSDYKKTQYNKFVNTLARPASLGQTILLILIGLVSISLALKIFVEFRKQHYRNVLAALVVLAVLLLLYAYLSHYVSHVLIL